MYLSAGAFWASRYQTTLLSLMRNLLFCVAKSGVEVKKDDPGLNNR